MTDLHFRSSKFDFCLYTKGNCWLIVFVDDLIITGNQIETENVVRDLKGRLNARDMGEVKRFLGMEILKIDKTLEITQRTYIEKVLKEFSMSECKGVSTPMSTGFTIDLSKNDTIDVPYRKLIGSLMYLACTSRPDIMYAVSYLSRFLDKPYQDLWTAGKRILRYLKNTIETGLFYKQGEGSLEAFSDADWAGDKSDRKSTSGSIILYVGNPMNWFSKKQSCVALSTKHIDIKEIL
ncbi:hypothetical protein JTB14_011699 [Gonioctena quinquepunctata]|nr:hypothetical protein JTB14_011699 [Gonioctena quinquepunctata]